MIVLPEIGRFEKKRMEFFEGSYFFGKKRSSRHFSLKTNSIVLVIWLLFVADIPRSNSCKVASEIPICSVSSRHESPSSSLWFLNIFPSLSHKSWKCFFHTLSCCFPVRCPTNLSLGMFTTIHRFILANRHCPKKMLSIWQSQKI